MTDTTTAHSEPNQPLGLALTDLLGHASEARGSLYELGLSWALAQSFACADNDAKWTADDVARAFEAGAKAMQAAAGRNMPEPAERLLRYAGQTMRTARSPNLTAREAIAVGNWMAARIRPPVADRYARAVLNDDGTLHNFILKIGGKPYRCECGCNVFHKPDRKHLDLYQCNACESRFEAA